MNRTVGSESHSAADPLDLAQALVRCPSVTPDAAAALSCLEGVLAPMGFDCHRLTFSEADTPDVDNLYARFGSEPPVLLFNGHVDVVPPGDEALWTHPPFSGAVEGGMLHGRGAVDMKGAIACFVAATRSFLSESGPPRGSIALAITGDEEGPAINGTRKLLDWAAERGERFDAGLVGEPTSRAVLGDMLKIGRRGSMSGTITVIGRQGHSAYPHQAVNPVHGLSRLIAALTESPLDEGTEAFQPSNLEITSVDVGNPAFNVIPERAVARFNIRFNDLHSVDSLVDRLRGTADRVLAGTMAVEIALAPNPAEVFRTHDPRLIGLMSEAVVAETGRRPEPSTTGGTSDARFVKDHCPVIEFGLVSETIHQIDECASIADLYALTAIYRSFLERYFSRD